MTDKSRKTWRCEVCGYIHGGSEPPDWCPVCGAEKNDFEPFVEETPAVIKAAAGSWQCLNCNYIHQGANPPDECPVCGALADRFETISQEGQVKAGAAMVQKVVIVGAGIAGISAAEALRRSSPETNIVLISKETDLPYYRLNLTRFLAGDVDEEALPIHPEKWYEEQNIELLRGKEVSGLDLDARVVALSDGSSISFEKMVMTIGAHPFIPPFPGVLREGVTSLRTVDNAKHILEEALAGKACVCIGGGLLGLETAGALAQRGSDVTLLEGHGWLMPRQLTQRAGELLKDHIESIGIKLITKARTEEIAGDEAVAGVILEDGTIVPAGLAVIATGVRPNSYIARRAGLEVNKGVVADNRLFSSHSDVLVAGDAAEHRGVLYGSWGASQFQGNIAGMNAAGLDAEFGGIPSSRTLKVLGIDMLSVGQFEPEDGSYVVKEQEVEGKYYRIVFRDGCVVGAILLGDTKVSSALKKAVESKTDFSGLLKSKPKATDIVEYLLQ
ncbi:FAD-dependent oxidoreductase [Acidobacteriota bacterium]